MAPKTSSKNPGDEFAKKRHAEEQRLFEAIRYKRRRIELAPTFPSEEEIQKKICRFMSTAISLIKSNTLQESFTNLRGNRPRYFARMEATLYKCRLENVRFASRCLEDKIRSAAEGLSMGYDLYNLLVLSESASSSSREKFFEKEIDGLSLEPCFTAEFMRKELEFLDEFIRNIETEIREAELQESNESHDSIFENIKCMIVDSQERVENKLAESLRTTSEQLQQLTSMEISQRIEKKLENLCQEVRQQREELSRIDGMLNQLKEIMETQKPLAEVATGKREPTPAPSQHDSEEQEDLLDLGEDILYKESDTEDSDIQQAQKKERVEKERRELEQRLDVLELLVGGNRRIPERKLQDRNVMRLEERYLRCAFCFEKGKHYSDGCPNVPTVEIRRRRVRCEICLAVTHTTDCCWKKEKECTYCKSREHHKALCILPERIHEYYRERQEIKEALERISNGPSTSKGWEYHRREKR